MNGEVPSVPITTLAGITSLTDLLPELPLPTPLSTAVSNKSLLHNAKLSEKSKRLLNDADDRLVEQVSAVLQKCTTEHIELKDMLAGDGLEGDLPELCKALLASDPHIFTGGKKGSRSHNGNQSPSSLHQRPHRGSCASVNSGSVHKSPSLPGSSDHFSNQSSSNINGEPFDKRCKRTATATMNSPAQATMAESIMRQSAPRSSWSDRTSDPEAIEIDDDDEEDEGPADRRMRSRSGESKKSSDSKAKSDDSWAAKMRQIGEVGKPVVMLEMLDPKRSYGDFYRKKEDPWNSQCRPLKVSLEPLDERTLKSIAEGGTVRTDPGKRGSKRHRDRYDDYDKTKRRRHYDDSEDSEEENAEQLLRRKKKEKRQRRMNQVDLTIDELLDSPTFKKFSTAIEYIFDSAEDINFGSLDPNDEEVECPPESLIARSVLSELASETAKLKTMGVLNQVPANTLVKLLTILQWNIRDGTKLLPLMNQDNEDEDDEGQKLWQEIAMERIGRSIDAALTAIYIITSPKMPKQVFLEDVIDRIVMFGKFQLTNTIYPEYDPVYRISPKNKDGYQGSSKMKRSRASQVKHKSTISLYNKLSDLVGCLAELVEIQELTDTIILQISGLGIAPFFVENVSELQLNAMKLVTTVFAYYDKHRQLVLEDIFASIARLPSSKRNLRSYRLNADEHIQMVTALALQLIQCVVRLPQPKETNNEVEDEQTDDFKTKNKEKSPKGKRKAAPSDPDVVIVTSYETAMRTGYNFLSVFLKKCTMKGEDDFRPMFENFVQDLLCTVNKPEWPASELLLSLLGKILVKQFSNKSIDMSLRTASLEYLGIVAARLRKDAVSSQLNQEVIDDIVNKVNESDEEEDEEVHKRSTRGRKTPEPKPVETMDVTQSLQKAMLDYLAYHGSSEPAYLFARQFYIAQWFRDTRKECEKNKGPDEDFDEEKEEKAIEQVGDTEERNKFLLSQVETNYKPYSSFKPLPTKLDYDSGCLVARYLSSKRPFAQSFDIYLGQILKVLAENAVAIRTKAMKCLTSVVESDPGILARPDMERGVHGRFLDPSTSVREAAIELVGKFVLIRPELIPQYYNMLSARILDTGISVRKRVIKIFREIFTVQPDFNKIPDMCVKMIRRVNDEDGIKKLVNEVFQTMWFTPLSAREKDSAKLIQRVVNITEVVAASKDTGFEFIEQLLDNLLKKDEHGNYNKSALTSCRQIVDCLVENVLRLEEKSVDGKVSNRLSACLSTLYLFSKIKPDLMIGHATTLQPYLNIKCSNPGDYWVLHYVARILELVATLNNGKVSNRLSACLSTLYLFSKIKPDLMIGHATTLQPYLNIKCSNPGDYWVLHYVARILELVTTLKNGKVSNRLSACLSTLYLFSKIKPDLMIGHATTLQPYLNIKCSNPGDYWVLHYVARILELVIPLMDHPGENFLAQVEEDMIKLILNHGMLVLESCVSCLGAVVNSVSHNYPLVKDCFRKFFSYIKKYAAYHKENPTVELQANRKPSLLRSLFTVGLMCKHFDFDKKDLRDSGESLKETIFDVLVYFTNHPDEDVQLKALMGLGFMAVRHYEYMLGRTLKSIYCDLLHVSHSALKLKCQVLKNLYLYLVEEEVRMAKSDAEWRAHAKEEDLKEMGDVQSGMASTIMQVYLKDVLESFFISKSQVRLEALNVIQLVLRQGLIHPVQCVPYLISMGTDAESAIRVKADQQLKEIDKKYPGFIHMKALHGIKMSFRLQDILQSDANNGIIRGLSNPEDNCSSLNAFLYSILRGNRSHRRALLTTLLNHLDDSAKIGLKEQVYLTDNLAFFAYQTQDEPLYIIHQIDIIVSVSGSNLLQSFREKLNGEEEKRPKMALANPLITENGMSEDYRPSIYEDDDDLDKDTLIDRLPDNIAPLKEIILLSQGCVLLLYLKQHLKDMYNFTDSKIQNYSPTEAAKVYDKPLQRKALVRFNPESVLNKLVQHTSNNCDDEEERENLADDYIQFRDLMLSVDPPDEDESDDNKSTGRQTPVTYSIKQRVDAGGDAAGTMNHVGENDTMHVNHEMNGEGDGESNQGFEKQSPEVEQERPRIPTLVISTSKLQTPSREKEKKKHIPRPTKALLPGASQFQTSAHTLSSPVHSHHTPSHHSHHSVPRSHHKTPSSQTKRKQQKKRKRARYGSDNSDNSDDSDYDPY